MHSVARGKAINLILPMGSPHDSHWPYVPSAIRAVLAHCAREQLPLSLRQEALRRYLADPEDGAAQPGIALYEM